MTPQDRKSTLIPLLFLLANAGLVVWIRRISKGNEADYDSSGFTLAAAPAFRQTVGYAPPPRPIKTMDRLERSFVKEPDSRLGGGRPEAGPRPAPSVRPRPARSIQVLPGTRRLVGQAARAYFLLKRSPRFRNSAAIRAWKRDFLSAAELRAADAQFQRDHDPVRFLAAVSRSPVFWLLLQRHLAAADVQAFVREMRTQPALAGASQELLKDPGLAATARLLAAVPTPP